MLADTVEGLATQAGLSRAAFAKREYGLAPGRYRNAVR